MRALKLFTILCLAIATAGCATCSKCVEAPQPPLKIMTFNILYGTSDAGENHWKKRRSLVFDQIREQAPDILGLQEALRFQLDEIGTAVPGYGEIGEGRGGGTRDEYAAILYRADRIEPVDSGVFWLSSTPEKVSQDWEAACLRICTWARLLDKATGRHFYCFNTHLDYRSELSRDNSVRLIAERAAHRAHPEDPVIFTGDFNAAEDSPAMNWLKTGRHAEDPAFPVLVDTFRATHPGVKTGPTYTGFDENRTGPKIDHILIWPGFKTAGAEILNDRPGGRFVSDHYAVTAMIEFDETALQ